MADIVTIGMDLDATKVVSGGKQAEQALTGVGTAAGRTDSAMAMLTKTAASLGLAFGAYKAVQMAQEVLTLGARYETLGVVVDRLGRNVNKSATEMRALEGELRKTGISMIEARSNIARMVQAEMDLTQATKLARVAQDAAVIGNMNSSEAFASLVYGIQTANTRVLRTIGIMTNFEQAYAKAAKTLNKNTEALTDQEKTQARVNAVTDAGGRITGAYEAAMETAGKQIQSTKRHLEDAKVKVSEAFQPAYTAMVFKYAEALKFIGDNATTISAALKVMMAVMAAKGISMGTAYLVAYNVQLKAATVQTGLLTSAMTTATAVAKGFWAAIGGWIGVAVIGALTANAALNKYLDTMLKAAGQTEAQIALSEKTDKSRQARADALEAAAAAAVAQADASKLAQKELGLELEKQTALVKAFGSTEHAMALLNLKYEEKEALAKAAEGVSAAEAKALQGMTAAIYAQKRALLELEEQKRKMAELIKPLETTMEEVSGAAATLMSLDRELEARKALLAATVQGGAAVRQLAIYEAGAAAAAQMLAAGMPGMVDDARRMAEEIARVNFQIEDAAQTAVDGTDIVADALAAMSQQLGGLAGDVGQVVAQFFLMAEAAQKAAEKAKAIAIAAGKTPKDFGMKEYMEAGAAAAAPAATAMMANFVFKQLGEMFKGRDEKALREAQQKNTEALERVAKTIEEMGEKLAGMTAKQITDFRAVLEFSKSRMGMPSGYAGGGISSLTAKEVGDFFGVDYSKLSGAALEAFIKVLQDALDAAAAYVQTKIVPEYAARAASLRGDDVEAGRIRREAAAAQEIKDLTDLANAGFISAEQLAEFARIINEELVVALKDAEKAAAAAAAAIVETNRAMREDLIVRGFAATGQTDAAARASMAFAQRRERIGMEELPEDIQALMLAVQDFERRVLELDLATNAQIKAIEEATAAQVKAIDAQIAAIEREIAARDFARSVIARGLRVTGRGDEADALEMGWQHQAERSQFAGNPIMLGFLDTVQGLERDSLARGQAVAAQTSAIQAGAAASQAAYDTQISVAQNQLSVAEEQLQAQQQTVEETRRVIEALDEFTNAVVLSDYSPLSPIQQLAEAKRQFAAMAAAAMSGDAGAAAGLPEAARALLDKSRGVNASNLGYATDFAGVQATIAAVRERFAGQLSQDEKVLAQMEGQSASLRAQIDAMVANREQVAVSAQAQIEALNAAAKQADSDAKAVYDAAWAIAKKEAERLETFKQEEIDRLARERDEAIAAAQVQIDNLNAFRDKQIATWATEFNQRVSALGLQTTANAWLERISGGVATVADEVRANAAESRATVRVLQAGVASLAERLTAVETAVAGVGTTVRRGLAE